MCERRLETSDIVFLEKGFTDTSPVKFKLTGMEWKFFRRRRRVISATCWAIDEREPLRFHYFPPWLQNEQKTCRLLRMHCIMATKYRSSMNYYSQQKPNTLNLKTLFSPPLHFIFLAVVLWQLLHIMNSRMNKYMSKKRKCLHCKKHLEIIMKASIMKTPKKVHLQRTRRTI